MCAGGRTAGYCSKECQAQHCKQHKVTFKAMAVAQRAKIAAAAFGDQEAKEAHEIRA
jgi:hypothetical protein